MTRTAVLIASMALMLGFAGGMGAGWLGLTPERVVQAPCSPGTETMRRIELVFGLARKDRLDVPESEWEEFLAREVTPRFPDGLTVLSGSGQWRNAAGAVVREPSRLLLVWAHAAPDLDARITAIREAWKSAQHQESVLRADGVSCVGF